MSNSLVHKAYIGTMVAGMLRSMGHIQAAIDELKQVSLGLSLKRSRSRSKIDVEGSFSLYCCCIFIHLECCIRQL